MTDNPTLNLADLKIRYEGTVLSIDELVLKYKNHPLTIEEEAKLPDCFVCYEKIRDTDELKILKPCNHKFHQSCLETWFKSIKHNHAYKYKHICPACGERCKIKATKNKCQAYTYSGYQCKNNKKYGNYCGIHKFHSESEV